MKFTLSWLKDHLDTTGVARRDRRDADAHRPRGRGRRGHERQVQGLRRRAGDRGQAAPERRPAEAVHGRRRGRAGAGRLRRAQRRDRHEERVLAGRDLYPGQEDHARQRRHPRRRVERHAVLGGRARALQRSRPASSNCPTTRRSASPYATYAGLDDPVIDVSLTPNRPDATGVAGIARDLAAAGLGKLKTHAPRAGRRELRLPDRGQARICSPRTRSLCPAFALRLVRGVNNGASPEWMQKRLRAIGLRPISALVDITNYSPSIAAGRCTYSTRQGQGRRSVVRRARAGESVLALDGKTYALDEAWSSSPTTTASNRSPA